MQEARFSLPLAFHRSLFLPPSIHPSISQAPHIQVLLVRFGAHQVVLVRTQASKERLPVELQSALTLTIFEAKGLEFDDVVSCSKVSTHASLPC